LGEGEGKGEGKRKKRGGQLRIARSVSVGAGLMAGDEGGRKERREKKLLVARPSY